MTKDRLLRLVVWAAAIWIAYEFLWYEQYKLTGTRAPSMASSSRWPIGSASREKPFRLFVASMEIPPRCWC